jgi:hypothetical protein
VVSIPEPDIDTERDKSHRELSHFEKRACLSYWYPKTHSLPSPSTLFVEAPITTGMLADKGELYREQIEKIESMVEEHAHCHTFPMFFRTGQTSGKHNWNQNCVLGSVDEVESRVRNLAQHSHIVSMVGLPLNVWAVREWIDIQHEFTAFGGMPVGREYRFFVQKGKVMHCQPYWPEEALEGYTNADGWKEDLRDLNQMPPPYGAIDIALLAADRITERFDYPESCWSVDVCKTEEPSWMMTDMAPAERSYFWDPNGDDQSLEEKIGGQNLNLPSNQSA